MGKTDLEQRYKSGHFSIQVQPDLSWKETKGTDSAINQASQGTWQLAKGNKAPHKILDPTGSTGNRNIKQMERREQLGTEGRTGTVEAKGKTARKDHCFGKIKKSS